jgi:hypothetical protein
MARTLHKLSAKRVEKEKKPGRHSDGGGLYLAIAEDGRRRWVFMWSRHGKQREIGVGSARDVTLVRARELAGNARKAVSDGLDPRTVRNPAGGKTFGDVADQLIASMENGWRNDKHRAQWKMTLTEYAKPLRSLDVDAFTTNDVLSVLQPIWTTKAETASRVRGRIEPSWTLPRPRGCALATIRPAGRAISPNCYPSASGSPVAITRPCPMATFRTSWRPCTTKKASHRRRWNLQS